MPVIGRSRGKSSNRDSSSNDSANQSVLLDSLKPSDNTASERKSYTASMFVASGLKVDPGGYVISDVYPEGIGLVANDNGFNMPIPFIQDVWAIDPGYERRQIAMRNEKLLTREQILEDFMCWSYHGAQISAMLRAILRPNMNDKRESKELLKLNLPRPALYTQLNTLGIFGNSAHPIKALKSLTRGLRKVIRAGIRETQGVDYDEFWIPSDTMSGFPFMLSPTMATGPVVAAIQYGLCKHVRRATEKNQFVGAYQVFKNALSPHFGEPYAYGGQRNQEQAHKKAYIFTANKELLPCVGVSKRPRKISYYPKAIVMLVKPFVNRIKDIYYSTSTHPQSSDVQKNTIEGWKRQGKLVLALDGVKNDIMTGGPARTKQLQEPLWECFGAKDLINEESLCPSHEFYNGRMITGEVGSSLMSGVGTVTAQNNNNYRYFVFSAGLFLRWFRSLSLDEQKRVHALKKLPASILRQFEQWAENLADFDTLREDASARDVDNALKRICEIDAMIAGDDVVLAVERFKEQQFSSTWLMFRYLNDSMLGQFAFEDDIAFLGQHYYDFTFSKKNFSLTSYGEDGSGEELDMEAPGQHMSDSLIDYVPCNTNYAVNRVVHKILSPERSKEYPLNAVGLYGRLEVAGLQHAYKDVVQLFNSAQFVKHRDALTRHFGLSFTRHLHIPPHEQVITPLSMIPEYLAKHVFTLSQMLDSFSYYLKGDTDYDLLPSYVQNYLPKYDEKSIQMQAEEAQRDSSELRRLVDKVEKGDCSSMRVDFFSIASQVTTQYKINAGKSKGLVITKDEERPDGAKSSNDYAKRVAREDVMLAVANANFQSLVSQRGSISQ